MTTAADLQAAADNFCRSRKIIRGADTGYTWRNGYNPNERQVDFPIEIDGEMPDGARLLLVGFPQAGAMKFRISLCYNAALCRLDYTDETHPNTLRKQEDNIPPIVTGPHYHSWRINKRFFKGASKAPELHSAEPFTMNASFDSIFRWFCHDTNIDQPSAGHLIELPPRDRLI
jgi:hypothetical protein